MTNGNKARAALEKYFPRPFTDLQWEMLAAQGYEQAVLAGERTPEAVAAEIQAMMAAVRGGSAGAQPSEPGPLPADPRNWEEMEKWVLARALVSGGSSRERERPAPAKVITGMGTYNTAKTPKTPEPPRRRRWFWAAAGGLAVAVIVAVLLLLFMGGEPTASTTTLPASTTVPAVTTTVPPTTTSSSTTSTTTILTTTTEVDLTPTFVAQLTGAEAIPAVTTDATGILTLTVAEDGASVDYVFEVSNLSDLTVARLRVAAAGATGDEVFTLFQGPTKVGSFSGVAAEGSITAAQLLGPLAGKTIADFVALLETGTVYLNVGTITNRDGELRGQLE